MDDLKKNLDQNFYKQLFQRFTKETLRQISENRSTALEYARKGIEQQEPDKLTDEYIETIADSMQAVAKTLLNEKKI